MICQRCRRSGILSQLLQQPQQTLTRSTTSPATQYQIPTLHQRCQIRAYSDGKPSVAPPPPSAPRQAVTDDITIPSAVSSATPGISQPLSTPEGVHAEVRPDQPTDQASATQRVPSSCPVGMKMGGLNYEKNKPDVYALEDSEYPDWLWGLLKEFEEKEKADKGGVDPKSMVPPTSCFFFFFFAAGVYCCCVGKLLTGAVSYEQKATKASREEARRPGCCSSAKDPYPPPSQRSHRCLIQPWRPAHD